MTQKAMVKQPETDLNAFRLKCTDPDSQQRVMDSQVPQLSSTPL